jgi:hypothetical protein
MNQKETYLGDGLYASFDGYQIKLRAPRENGDHEVFLEAPAIKSFVAFCVSQGLKDFFKKVA